MLAVSCVLIYLAVVKKYEPLLLLPIAFGMLLANLPMAGLMDGPSYEYFTTATHNGKMGIAVTLQDGTTVYQYIKQAGGLLYYLYQGVKLGIYPPLIFLGVGAMTDFGPLIANPKSLLLGAAAQLGIFVTFIGAQLLGFTPQESSSIGIIGGADGPTAIYLTGKLAPHLLGPIAVAAYSYMLHGNAVIGAKPGKASGLYQYDVSRYVIGWILGIECEAYLVEGTNKAHPNITDFQGKYIYTVNASPFEVFAAQMQELAIAYEVEHYQMQRPVAFSNWITTDPLTHPNEPRDTEDSAVIDVEHIHSTPLFTSGFFASYHERRGKASFWTQYVVPNDQQKRNP